MVSFHHLDLLVQLADFVNQRLVLRRVLVLSLLDVELQFLHLGVGAGVLDRVEVQLQQRLLGLLPAGPKLSLQLADF